MIDVNPTTIIIGKLLANNDGSLIIIINDSYALIVFENDFESKE